MSEEKHYAIKRTNFFGYQVCYAAMKNYILGYTNKPEFIKRFATREEAEKDLRNEMEVIVDLRHDGIS